MDNPNYTEHQIDEAIKAHTKRNITVKWDGWEPEQDGAAYFDVYLNGEDTGVTVCDYGRTFEIVERTGRRSYATVDWAVHYDHLASKLTDLVEEAIATGELGDEE